MNESDLHFFLDIFMTHFSSDPLFFDPLLVPRQLVKGLRVDPKGSEDVITNILFVNLTIQKFIKISYDAPTKV